MSFAIWHYIFLPSDLNSSVSVVIIDYSSPRHNLLQTSQSFPWFYSIRFIIFIYYLNIILNSEYSFSKIVCQTRTTAESSMVKKRCYPGFPKSICTEVNIMMSAGIRTRFTDCSFWFLNIKHYTLTLNTLTINTLTINT